jgi:hypothetical protein
MAPRETRLEMQNFAPLKGDAAKRALEALLAQERAEAARAATAGKGSGGGSAATTQGAAGSTDGVAAATAGPGAGSSAAPAASMSHVSPSRQAEALKQAAQAGTPLVEQCPHAAAAKSS